MRLCVAGVDVFYTHKSPVYMIMVISRDLYSKVAAAGSKLIMPETLTFGTTFLPSGSNLKSKKEAMMPRTLL